MASLFLFKCAADIDELFLNFLDVREVGDDDLFGKFELCGAVVDQNTKGRLLRAALSNKRSRSNRTGGPLPFDILETYIAD